jgi:hypothetical protein
MYLELVSKCLSGSPAKRVPRKTTGSPKKTGSSSKPSKSSSSSKGHANALAKLDVAIKSGTMLVGAVTAGTGIANLVKKPATSAAPAPKRREFDNFELYVREPVNLELDARAWAPLEELD